MHHVALFNKPYRVLLIPSLALLVADVACAAQQSALTPSPNTPAVIYAIPQSQAFAIARKAIQSSAAQCGADEVHISDKTRGGGLGGPIRGYEADYHSWIYHSFALRYLYVVPTAGIAGSGQQVDGYRFEITYRWPGVRLLCEKALASTLQTALDATGTATSVTGLRLRPYGEGSAAP
jgi:hypothetical protein